MSVSFLSSTTRKILLWEFIVLSALVLYRVVGSLFVHR